MRDEIKIPIYPKCVNKRLYLHGLLLVFTFGIQILGE